MRWELLFQNIGNLCRSTDILAYNEIKALIEKLKK